jgi:hypothetical protein
MSQETMILVLAKAIVDPGFRTLFFADSEAALAEHDLTADEKATLGKVSEDALDALAFEVEERLSTVTPVPIPESQLLNWREHITKIELETIDLSRVLGR